ncbi:MAG TPA: flagellar biosynthetic protein FlhB, partial [Methylotenera sp.]|nr:flagellar biosynthetic protein FlhB [Methylotenera sp.]
LAYVFQMRIFNKDGGYRPEMPTSLLVPEGMDPHSLLPIPNTVTDEVLA